MSSSPHSHDSQIGTAGWKRRVRICDDSLLALFEFCACDDLAQRLSLINRQFWRCARPRMHEQNAHWVDELHIGAIYETQIEPGSICQNQMQQRQVFRDNTIYLRTANQQEEPAKWKRVPIPVVPPPANIIGIRRIVCVSRLNDEIVLGFFPAIAHFLHDGVLSLRSECNRNFLGGPSSTWAAKLYVHFHRCKELAIQFTGYEGHNILNDPLFYTAYQLRLRCSLSSADFLHVAMLCKIVLKWLRIPLQNESRMRRLLIQREMPQYHRTFPECAFRSIINTLVRHLIQDFLLSTEPCQFALRAFIHVDQGDTKVADPPLDPFRLQNVHGEVLAMTVESSEEGIIGGENPPDLVYSIRRCKIADQQETSFATSEQIRGCHVELI